MHKLIYRTYDGTKFHFAPVGSWWYFIINYN